MRLNIFRTSFLALVLSLLVACGGGGEATGTCVFGPEACNVGGGGGGAQGSGSGSGSSAATFIRSGTGDTSFALPSNVTTIRVQAQFPGASSNFVVRADNQLLVNALIGSLFTSATHDGTYTVPAGATLEISDSNGVEWTISAVNVTAPSGAAFSKVGSGADVFLLPARASRYRVTGTFTGTTENFVVFADDRLLINSIIGTSSIPESFDGTYSLPASARIEIRDADGVSWTFTESP